MATLTSFSDRNPTPRRSPRPEPPAPGPPAAGASVGGGWRPTNPEAASRRDPAAGDPSVSSWQLYQGGAIQLHPDTANDDQFLQKLQAGSKSP